MDDLIPYIQQEFASYRRDCKVLGTRYPGLANQVGFAEDACGDPQVERLIQSCGVFSARIRKALEEAYPRLTEALLHSTYPHYLYTHPSCSIVEIDHDAGAKGTKKVPRGTEMRSRPVQGTRCQFRTCSDVVLSPLSVSSARYSATATGLPGHRLDNAYDAAFVIRLSSPVPIKDLGMKRLTLFIDGDPSLCVALRDALFLHTGPAFVQAREGAYWHALDEFPVTPKGFDDEDAMLPWPARSHPAYRLLTEYFAFPDKFNFIDIDLAALLDAIPQAGNELTLHLPVRGLGREAGMARTLSAFSAANLRTHCTPVINLFPRGAAPIDLNGRAAEYPVVIDLARPASCEIYTIDAARVVSGSGSSQRVADLSPFYGPHHGQGTPDTPRAGYWIIHRDEMTVQCDPGRELRIAIVDNDMRPATPEAQTLSIDATCSNRDLPALLPFGRPEGDLEAGGVLENTPVRFLRKPTPSRRFPSDDRSHWRLISHLALNQRMLSDIGLVELRKMLDLYDLPRSPVTQRQIAGIVALSNRNVQEWIKGGIGGNARSALMSGVEIRLTVDESAYVGSGLHAFVQLLDRFFALYGQINVYTQLIVVSEATGKEILKCRPRSGMMILA